MPKPTESAKLLTTLARDLRDIAHGLGLENVAREIEGDTARRLEHGRIRVVVLGEIKHGKSSLINALIGEEALPIGVTPTTGAVVQVRAGTEQGWFRIGAKGPKPITPERFAELARGRNRGRPAIVEYVHTDAQVPATIELIDTPGINDIERFQGAVSRGELPRADALVLVLDATQLLNRTELALLRDALSAVGGLGASGAELMLVINRIDLVADHERSLLVDHLLRQLRGLGGVGKHLDESDVFQTDARSAARTPGARAHGVREVARLRKRLTAIAGQRSTVLPARARASLLQYATLLGHNAAIHSRALTLKKEALGREIKAVEEAAQEQQAELETVRKVLAEHQARLMEEAKGRTSAFRDRLQASALAHVELATLRTLATHLPGSIHDAFVSFAQEESERLRTELDELTRQALHTYGEQARRRLVQATLRLGLRGPTVYLDPPSIVLEAGLAAVGVVGTAIMYFGNLAAGLVMTIAGPLTTLVLREKSLRDARRRARELIPTALDRSTSALLDAIERVVIGHVVALEEHLVLASSALGEQLLAVLRHADHDLSSEDTDDDDDLDDLRDGAQLRLRAIEGQLGEVRQALQGLQI